MAAPMDTFPMENKPSPFGLGRPQIALALNAESEGAGHFSKRRGVNTRATITSTFGSTAPFSLFEHVYGGTSYLIAVGADAIAFTSPFNGYLYSRTSSNAYIGENPGHGSWPAEIDSEWGIAAPSGPFTTNNVDGSSVSHASALCGGAYAVAATCWNENRQLESGPLFATSLTTSGNGSLSSLIQYLPGPGRSIEIISAASKDAKASHIRAYVERLQLVDKSTNWLPVNSSRFGLLGMRGVYEGTSLPSRISGLEIGGGFLPYSHTVVPQYTKVAEMDGRWFYGSGYLVVYSNPNCPETYAKTATVNSGPATPILAASENGILRGETTFTVKPSRGTITGFATAGDEMLVLCQYGAWPVLRNGDGATYGRGQAPYSHGTQSKATVCETPYGAMWLADDGIALWPGRGDPTIITREVLNLYGTEVDASADLSTACAAYDHKRNRYVVTIPTASKSGTCSGGSYASGVTTVTATTNVFTVACEDRTIAITGVGSFTISQYLGPTQVIVTGDAHTASGAAFTIAAGQCAIVLEADFLDQRQVVVRRWNLKHSSSVTGMGWSNSLKEIVWLFQSGVAEYAVDGSYQDVYGALTSYDFGMDIIQGAERPDCSSVVKPELLIHATRRSIAQQQTISVVSRGMLTADIASGGTGTESVTWAASDYLSKAIQSQQSGPLVRWRLRNTDAYALDITRIVFRERGETGRRDRF